MPLFFVDCEAPYGVGSPAVGDMTEFAAVEYETGKFYHGVGCTEPVFSGLVEWLQQFDKPYVFVSDNPAYDWQWINFYFWKHLGYNPFGHSARRIGDFYAGLKGNFRKTQEWKRLRITKHTHNPVDDATGNLEAFRRLIAGER